MEITLSDQLTQSVALAPADRNSDDYQAYIALVRALRRKEHLVCKLDQLERKEDAGLRAVELREATPASWVALAQEWGAAPITELGRQVWQDCLRVWIDRSSSLDSRLVSGVEQVIEFLRCPPRNVQLFHLPPLAVENLTAQGAPRSFSVSLEEAGLQIYSPDPAGAIPEILKQIAPHLNPPLTTWDAEKPFAESLKREVTSAFDDLHRAKFLSQPSAKETALRDANSTLGRIYRLILAHPESRAKRDYLCRIAAYLDSDLLPLARSSADLGFADGHPLFQSSTELAASQSLLKYYDWPDELVRLAYGLSQLSAQGSLQLLGFIGAHLRAGYYPAFDLADLQIIPLLLRGGLPQAEELLDQGCLVEARQHASALLNGLMFGLDNFDSYFLHFFSIMEQVQLLGSGNPEGTLHRLFHHFYLDDKGQSLPLLTKKIPSFCVHAGALIGDGQLADLASMAWKSGNPNLTPWNFVTGHPDFKEDYLQDAERRRLLAGTYEFLQELNTPRVDDADFANGESALRALERLFPQSSKRLAAIKATRKWFGKQRSSSNHDPLQGGRLEAYWSRRLLNLMAVPMLTRHPVNRIFECVAQEIRECLKSRR